VVTAAAAAMAPGDEDADEANPFLPLLPSDPPPPPAAAPVSFLFGATAKQKGGGRALFGAGRRHPDNLGSRCTVDEQTKGLFELPHPVIRR